MLFYLVGRLGGGGWGARHKRGTHIGNTYKHTVRYMHMWCSSHHFVFPAQLEEDSFPDDPQLLVLQLLLDLLFVGLQTRHRNSDRDRRSCILKLLTALNYHLPPAPQHSVFKNVCCSGRVPPCPAFPWKLSNVSNMTGCTGKINKSAHLLLQ